MNIVYNTFKTSFLVAVLVVSLSFGVVAFGQQINQITMPSLDGANLLVNNSNIDIVVVSCGDLSQDSDKFAMGTANLGLTATIAKGQSFALYNNSYANTTQHRIFRDYKANGVSLHSIGTVLYGCDHTLKPLTTLATTSKDTGMKFDFKCNCANGEINKQFNNLPTIETSTYYPGLFEVNKNSNYIYGYNKGYCINGELVNNPLDNRVVEKYYGKVATVSDLDATGACGNTTIPTTINNQNSVTFDKQIKFTEFKEIINPKNPEVNSIYLYPKMSEYYSKIEKDVIKPKLCYNGSPYNINEDGILKHSTTKAGDTISLVNESNTCSKDVLYTVTSDKKDINLGYDVTVNTPKIGKNSTYSGKPIFFFPHANGVCIDGTKQTTTLGLNNYVYNEVEQYKIPTGKDFSMMFLDKNGNCDPKTKQIIKKDRNFVTAQVLDMDLQKEAGYMSQTQVDCTNIEVKNTVMLATDKAAGQVSIAQNPMIKAYLSLAKRGSEYNSIIAQINANSSAIAKQSGYGYNYNYNPDMVKLQMEGNKPTIKANTQVIDQKVTEQKQQKQAQAKTLNTPTTLATASPKVQTAITEAKAQTLARTGGQQTGLIAIVGGMMTLVFGLLAFVFYKRSKTNQKINQKD
jgi:LPXTG-motif cell wall-anchored protein